MCAAQNPAKQDSYSKMYRMAGMGVYLRLRFMVVYIPQIPHPAMEAADITMAKFQERFPL